MPLVNKVASLVGRLFKPNVAKMIYNNNINGLGKALTYHDPEVRKTASDALINIGAAAVVPLLARLNHKNYLTRRDTAILLGELRDPRAVKSLLENLSDDQVEVRDAAARAIVKIGSAGVDTILVNLKNGREWAGGWAAWLLGEIGDARAVLPLIEKLKDSHPYTGVKYTVVAEALAKLGDPRAVDPLITGLKDWFESNRKAAFQALVTMKSVSVVPLQKQLDGQDGVFCQLGAETLDAIGWKPGDEEQRASYLIAKGSPG